MATPQALWSPKKAHREGLRKSLDQRGTPGMSDVEKKKKLGQVATTVERSAGVQQRNITREGLGSTQPSQYAAAQGEVAKETAETVAGATLDVEAESTRIAQERDAVTKASLEREYDRRLSAKMQRAAMRKGGAGGIAGKAAAGAGMDKILGMIGK
jgi:hypothetical protein